MFSIKKEHKQHLTILFPQPPQVLQDFCRLALDYLRKGYNFKLYSTASQKLGVSVEEIQRAIEGLLYLLVESQRHGISLTEFEEVVLAVGFDADQAELLSGFLKTSQDEINSTLQLLAPTLPHYHDLEWRFDVQVASRALHSQITPNLTMKLTLKNNHSADNTSGRTSVLLQTDPSNLKHMIEKFDQVLQEASSQHLRRVHRALK